MRALTSERDIEPTIAFNVRICDSGGTITETILSIQASDSGNVLPPGFSDIGYVNRSFQNSSEVKAIPYSSFKLNDNDRIVVEIGYRQGEGDILEDCRFRYGNNSASDLPENETSTDDYNPWIEFSDWT